MREARGPQWMQVCRILRLIAWPTAASLPTNSTPAPASASTSGTAPAGKTSTSAFPTWKSMTSKSRRRRTCCMPAHTAAACGAPISAPLQAAPIRRRATTMPMRRWTMVPVRHWMPVACAGETTALAAVAPMQRPATTMLRPPSTTAPAWIRIQSSDASAR